MNAAALWLPILAAAVVLEAIARCLPTRVASLGRTTSLLARRIYGRVVLLLLWVFVGVHLFARYTIPHG